VRRLSPGADLSSTAGCLRALGVEIEGEQVVGRGLHGLLEPAGPLDCGNSGTTMRLLAGLLAARPFESTLVGDESLSRRPMDRLAPLDVDVPGDLSAAAFWLVAAALHGTGAVRLPDVGVNPRRAGVLVVLRRMGVRVSRAHERNEGEEPVADLEVGPAWARRS